MGLWEFRETILVKHPAKCPAEASVVLSLLLAPWYEFGSLTAEIGEDTMYFKHLFLLLVSESTLQNNMHRLLLCQEKWQNYLHVLCCPQSSI